jgi:hypothetical protein
LSANSVVPRTADIQHRYRILILKIVPVISLVLNVAKIGTRLHLYLKSLSDPTSAITPATNVAILEPYLTELPLKYVVIRASNAANEKRLYQGTVERLLVIAITLAQYAATMCIYIWCQQLPHVSTRLHQ